MDKTPTTSRSLGRTYHIDGDQFERAYKYHLSDFPVWDQKDHAKDWVLYPINLGEDLSIDETSL